VTPTALRLEGARALVAQRLGLDFPERRGDDLERALGSRDLAQLWAQPVTGPEWRDFIHALTVRESHFFRDGELFAALEQRVLPELIAARPERLAIWSAGCATGEEPYSLALVLDRLLGDRAARAVTLIATDVDAVALESARRGLYTDWSLRGLPAWARASGLRTRARRHEVRPELRARVSFAPLNLAGDPYPCGLDLIVCRNVLMYFTEPARRTAVERLAAALAPGGWLALSPLDTESDPPRGLEPAGPLWLLRREAAA
jgi:chemotaxis protein methyltransferase CheR